MSTSFTDVLDHLKSVLESDANLQSFCQASWGKNLAAQIVFKHRREIGMDQLPLILITRPQVRDRRGVRAQQEARHTVRLYCGFWQKDPARAEEHRKKAEALRTARPKE